MSVVGDERVVREALLELVQHHERVDVALDSVLHERVRDLVLDVARRDAVEALARRLLAELLHVVLRVARQRLAVVELHLLEQR
jgi:NAD(P)-dependent dehydrogenase (short-subunit alcohol dehydrogenase family)